MPLLLFAVCAAAPARADDAVTVLGIRSVDGDDRFARSMTNALRRAAGRVANWQVSRRDITLAQMALAHGCGENPQPECLVQIAASLSARKLIYGEVRRTSAAANYAFSFSLYMFDAESEHIEGTLSGTISQDARSPDALSVPARSWIQQLAGIALVGSLRISVEVPEARVFVDDELVGQTGQDGALRVPEVAAGNRRVRVEASGYRAAGSTVAVEAFTETRFEAILPPVLQPEGEGVDPALVAGIGLAGFAGVSVVLMVIALTQIESLNADAQFLMYREALAAAGTPDPLGIDACEAASRGLDFNGRASDAVIERSRTVCQDADVWQVLQFTFLGTAIASALAATILFIGWGSAQGDESEGPATTFQLLPSIGPRRASLDLRVTF